MTKMPGKTPTIEASIDAMREALDRLGFEVEEQNWHNPVPHVWSVEVQDKACEILRSSGKGVTPEAAQASALGGFIERMATQHYFADYYLGPEIAQAEFVQHPQERWFKAHSNSWPLGILDEHSRNHYDPHEQVCAEHLIEINSSNEVRGICALPFTRQSDGEQVWFPVNLINNLYDSNGMAAGNTVAEARVQAISEVYERHIKATIIANGIALPRIPPKVIARHAKVEAAVKALRVKGFVVDVRDASLGGKYPLVAISLFDRNSAGALMAFGAHPKFATALERALTTLLQGRSLESLQNLPELTFDLSDAASSANLTQHMLHGEGVLSWDMYSDQSHYPFTEWNIEGDAEAEFRELLDRMHKVDIEVYVAEYSQIGIPVCRMLVPGMSEIKPVEDLVVKNSNAIISLRPLIFALPQLDEDELLDLLDELNELNFDGATRLSSLLGMAVDSEEVSVFTLAELKLRIALAVGEADLLPGLLQVVLELSSLPQQRRTEYQLLGHLVEIELDKNRKQIGFERILQAVYGEQAYSSAKQLLKGEGVFTALMEKLENLNRSQGYLALLQAAQKARKAFSNENG